MKNKTKTLAHAAVVLFAACGVALAGNSFKIDWHSIDGGGVMQSTGGDFVLSGTLGQLDANAPATALTGGEFRMIGGFWAVSLEVCTCLADVNGDTKRDGADVQDFVTCFLATGTGCRCADLDGNFLLDSGDVILFVDDLLLGDPCL